MIGLVFIFAYIIIHYVFRTGNANTDLGWLRPREAVQKYGPFYKLEEQMDVYLPL